MLARVSLFVEWFGFTIKLNINFSEIFYVALDVFDINGQIIDFEILSLDVPNKIYLG